MGDYPQHVKAAVEAAGKAARRKTRQQQASRTTDTTSNDFHVFLVHHEVDMKDDVQQAAVEQEPNVMEVFKERYEDVVEEDNFVREGQKAGENQVTWNVDEIGALSLEYTDAAEGDFFTVHVVRHIVVG
ncbi:hypothetical protein BU16DRAFT_560905 [Lophium mytilinum]|uniref:Uncharacterized protein n=1 Tax=Lophium mytilinum TaxID=390894 RepID=A0A6A6QV61_9PEZI|nr:hypothetical protein BU16DRAFT_560905 [Lophium mytilinum]